MKATGYIRNVNKLGRMTIPPEVREMVGFSDGDIEVIMSIDGSQLILEKARKSCVFCGRRTDLFAYLTRFLCIDCLKNIREIKE